MAQHREWEGEYRKPRLVTKDESPQRDTMDFLRFLRREQGIDLSGSCVLDIGSGTGRNANHIAAEGAKVVGLEISETALKLAVERGKGKGDVRYFQHDIGSPYPLSDASYDIALDVMSSNSLSDDEREIYAREVHRVLRPGGWFFVKALCKDADKNAHALLKSNPGKEKDTYRIPEWGLEERVWSRQDFVDYYSPFFDIEFLEKKTNYSTFDGRKYKRNFWLAYLRNR